MTDAEGFLDATCRYERWRASRIAVIEEDVARKHDKLMVSPFVLLRGTYYRFLQQFPALLPKLAAAPATLVVGDLHVENFGTWRDRDGRLGWGINDFDEVDLLPYTIDLVRLAASALLAAQESHLGIDRDAVIEAILAGWRERIAARRSEAFILGERHPHLYKLASEAFEDPGKFARRLKALDPWEGTLPSPAARLLVEVAPWRDYEPRLFRRVAGVGSLGARRIVAIGDLAGGPIVREAKEIPGPASSWLNPKRGRVRGLAGLVVDARGIAAEPWRRQSGKWVLRRLAPDSARLALAALRRKHDEAAVLRSMGAEAANVHLCPHVRAASPDVLREDERARPKAWLLKAAEAMAQLTERDHAELLAAATRAAPGARATRSSATRRRASAG
jgi:Uncharacterized protein conserved in bacteria (DUF2252)